MSDGFMREHRAHKVEKERVKHLCHGGYASGGRVDVGEKQYKRSLGEDAAPVAELGKPPKRRSDRPMRAKGGRVKGGKGKGHTNVNVIVAPSGGPQAGLGPKPIMPPPGLAPPPPMPPPMAAKPPMPMPPPGAAPPGMPPMRAKGGRVPHDVKEPPRKVAKVGKIESAKHKSEGTDTLAGPTTDQALTKRMAAKNAIRGGQYAKGGKVNAGANETGKTGVGFRLPVQHSGNKDDTQNIGRKKPMTYATGGPIYSDGMAGEDMGPKLPAGSRSGLARIAKAHRMAGKAH